MFGIFIRVRDRIKYKVSHHQPGLYLYILFPISFAFLLTFGLARAFSLFYPAFHIPWSDNFRVHHFAYGFFVLMASGYLALVFSGPRARYLISLLHGFGLGLVFDEFWYWLKLEESELHRWSYDGFLVFGGVVLLILSAKPGINMLKALWPFKRHKNHHNHHPNHGN